MTRKDFEIIARALFDSNLDGTQAAKDQWSMTLHEVAKALASTNSRFDWAKFTRYAQTGKY
jgi:hypothetical protein